MWDFVMDKSGAGAGFLRELRNEYQESLEKIKKPGGKVRQARRADNLAAIY
jgi:hypothetical protein